MWWKKLARNEPLVCVYCAAETSVAEDEEHILPESLGNEQTLYRGAVCNYCNHALGCNVDSKIFNEALVAAGQVAREVEGKKGVRSSIGQHVRKTESGVEVKGAISGGPQFFEMSRAIAKCGVNILTNFFGSLEIHNRYPELIKYVLQPRNRQDIWPCAYGLTPLGGFEVAFDIGKFEHMKDATNPFFYFTCASGIFAAFTNRDEPKAQQVAMSFVELGLAGISGPRMTFWTLHGLTAER